jgi:hypothetical protein
VAYYIEYSDAVALLGTSHKCELEEIADSVKTFLAPPTDLAIRQVSMQCIRRKVTDTRGACIIGPTIRLEQVRKRLEKPTTGHP